MTARRIFILSPPSEVGHRRSSKGHSSRSAAGIRVRRDGRGARAQTGLYAVPRWPSLAAPERPALTKPEASSGGGQKRRGAESLRARSVSIPGSPGSRIVRLARDAEREEGH